VDEPGKLAVQLRHGPFAEWSAQMGLMASALGVAGLAWGALRRPLRIATVPLAAFVVADCFLPSREAGALAADPVLTVRLLAVAALAVGAALGVRSAVVVLDRLRIPFASSAAVLLVVYHFTLVFMAEETSADVIAASDHLGADVWADEALGELPPNALPGAHADFREALGGSESPRPPISSSFRSVCSAGVRRCRRVR
jgi:hypothetical protein